ncbi:MAG: hypothetical protein KatS3mg071_1975 [Meiothermus sp.]|nr:MAG: hypothetical protein KatS3mg071_1975 [Meiothermus sp.]
MEKTTLYLPPELHQALKNVAKQEGKSQAELIREVLAAYLAKRNRPHLQSIGVAGDQELAGRDSEIWLEKAWLEL